MIQKLCTVFFGATLFSLQLYAQVYQPCSQSPAKEIFQGNEIRLKLSIAGGADYFAGDPLVVGYDGTPKPSIAIYTGGIWIGGIDPAGNLRLAVSEYGPMWQDYAPGPLGLNGEPDALNCEHWNRFWKVSRTEIEAQRADFADNGQIDQPLAAVMGWPGAGNPYFEAVNGFLLPQDTASLAPFYDLNGDGLYNPFQGDYPHPKGLNPEITVAEMIWCVFNSGASNLDCEVHATLWSLACSDNDLLNNAYFQSFEVFNRGSDRLDSLIMGIWQDPDLGCTDDDYIGTNEALQTVYVYNGDNEDGPCNSEAYGDNPPAGALTLLNRPLYKSMYYNNQSVGNFPAATTDPSQPTEYYNYLNGRWRDGTSFTAGDSGYNPGGPAFQPANHYFSGDPNDPNSWSIGNENLPISDRRTIASAYLGTLMPGEMRTLDLAYSFHRGPGLDHLQNVTYLFDRVAELKQAYDQGFVNACSYTLCSNDCVWPGDTNRDGIVNHCDILPIGTALNASGPARDELVTWAPKEAIDWGQNFNQSYDYKHLDANGDGVIGLTDVDLVGGFYDNTTPWWSPVPDTYQIGDNFFMKTLPGSVDTNNIQSGQTVIVVVQYDSLLALTGGAYQIEWDTAYWQILTATGPVGGGVFRGLSRRYDTELSYGRIALPPSTGLTNSAWSTIQMKARDIAPMQSNTTYIRLKNIKGIAADGSDVALGAHRVKFKFAGGTSNAGEPEQGESWRIFPNPATVMITVEAPGEQLFEAVFYDVTGRILSKMPLAGNEKAELTVGHLPRGMVFLQLYGESGVVVRKVVLGN